MTNKEIWDWVWSPMTAEETFWDGFKKGWLRANIIGLPPTIVLATWAFTR